MFLMTRKRLILTLVGLCATALAQAQTITQLRQGFRTPPGEAKPRVWWHWIDGNVALDGAKLDLEWMQRVGVGGVHTFSGGGFHEPTVVATPLPFMSEGWQNVFRQTTELARKAGMEVTIAGSPGWSETGGVWVTPEHAMKKYVWSETEVMGGASVSQALPQPPSVTGPFQAVKASFRGAPPVDLTHDVYADAIIVAFPTPKAETTRPQPQYTTVAGSIDISPIAKNDLANIVPIPLPSGSKTAWIQATFAQPIQISALVLGLETSADVEVLASNDGQSFRSLMHAAADTSEHPSPQQTYTFAPVITRMVRIVLTQPAPAPPLPGLPKAFSLFSSPPAKQFGLRRLSLVNGRVDRFESKAGFIPAFDFSSAPTIAPEADAIIDPKSVIDLSGKLSPDGRLQWTPPPGRWTVLRLGYSLTGQTNGPAEAAATGLEVDKLDAGMVREYMEHYLALYAGAMGTALGPGSVQNVLTDSWEAGVQNWTPRMMEEFRKRRGYDPTPFIPVLAGRVVKSAEMSDRFLWDFRRTLKEMLVDNHYDVLAKVVHEHGMGYYTEAEGDTQRSIGDGLSIKSRADIPTAEYWYRQFAAGPGQPTLKADMDEAASAAHVYGKQYAAAESLTVAAGDDPWAFSPGMQKPVADEIFAHGINRILIHESHHQPLVAKKPGLEMLFFGQYFNRDDTWAEQAGPWVSYLARSSYLLQQGKYVADIAYFYGEDRSLTELFTGRFNNDVPQGYHYDYINAEALLNLLHVDDGKLLTPSGMSYGVLYLPANANHLTLPTLARLRDLVAAGAVLVGPKTEGGLGVSDHDSAIAAIADELWGKTPTIGARRYGKGRVYAEQDLGQVLRKEHIAPDAALTDSNKQSDLLTLHRHLDDSDLYFISNQQDHPEITEMTFRVSGVAPEVWHAEDGSMEPASYKRVDGGTEVSLNLAAKQAVFVVFHKSAVPAVTLPESPSTILGAIDQPWSVHFEPGCGAPASATFRTLASWTDSTDTGIRYFSGTATYQTKLQASAAWLSAKQRIQLDLGEVHELAQVSINGRRLNIAWHAPYIVDITDTLRAGANDLQIEVTNLWVNRLIGDKMPGAEPCAFAPQSPYTAGSPLMVSGLLGPVRILSSGSASAMKAPE